MSSGHAVLRKPTSTDNVGGSWVESMVHVPPRSRHSTSDKEETMTKFLYREIIMWRCMHCRDAALHLKLLQLLDKMVHMPANPTVLKGNASDQLLANALLPQLQWRPGKAAMALRHVASACLVSFLEHNAIHEVGPCQDSPMLHIRTGTKLLYFAFKTNRNHCPWYSLSDRVYAIPVQFLLCT